MQDEDEFDPFNYDATCRQWAGPCDDYIIKIIVPGGFRYECLRCGRPGQLITSSSS